MSTHTPGPWELHFHDASQVGYIDAGTVQFCVRRTSPDGFQQMRANARLIAAAPELLALAHQYAEECGECAGTRVCPDDEPCTECADIWTVIDRAEGRT